MASDELNLPFRINNVFLLRIPLTISNLTPTLLILSIMSFPEPLPQVECTRIHNYAKSTRYSTNIQIMILMWQISELWFKNKNPQVNNNIQALLGPTEALEWQTEIQVTGYSKAQQEVEVRSVLVTTEGMENLSFTDTHLHSPNPLRR